MACTLAGALHPIMKRSASIIVVLMAFLQGFAQDSNKHSHLKASVMGNYQTGNLNQISVSSQLNRVTTDTMFNTSLNISYTYVHVEDFTIINDLWINQIVDLHRGKTFYRTAQVIAGTALSYRIDQSLFAGIGVGYRPNLDGKLSFKSNLYAAYFHFKPIESSPIQTPAVGTDIVVNYKLKKAILNWNVGTFHGINPSNIWGGSSNIQVLLPISKQVFVNLSHRTFFNAREFPDTEKLNSMLMYGINIKLNK